MENELLDKSLGAVIRGGNIEAIKNIACFSLIARAIVALALSDFGVKKREKLPYSFLMNNQVRSKDKSSYKECADTSYDSRKVSASCAVNIVGVIHRLYAISLLLCLLLESKATCIERLRAFRGLADMSKADDRTRESGIFMSRTMPSWKKRPRKRGTDGANAT